jgi:hypothetical protein
MLFNEQYLHSINQPNSIDDLFIVIVLVSTLLLGGNGMGDMMIKAESGILLNFGFDCCFLSHACIS